jgi:hypothetical protein
MLVEMFKIGTQMGGSEKLPITEGSSSPLERPGSVSGSESVLRPGEHHCCGLIRWRQTQVELIRQWQSRVPSGIGHLAAHHWALTTHRRCTRYRGPRKNCPQPLRLHRLILRICQLSIPCSHESRLTLTVIRGPFELTIPNLYDSVLSPTVVAIASVTNSSNLG